VPTEKSLKPDYFIGDITLMIDGKEVGKLEGIKSAGQYSAVTGYGLVTGRNPNTPVTHEYKAPFAFTGQLDKVTIKLE
jgi:arylsulfatase